ncbi:MAG: hypothetical protein Kow00129_16670 [Thermoleophilia bacterium]
MGRPPSSIPELIAQEGSRVSFARFMELALTHPVAGYYAREVPVLGARGDFTTAPLRTPAFARGVARIVGRLLDGIFTVSPGLVPLVAELGAGTGVLAAGVLEEWERAQPDLIDRVSFCAVDSSAARRSEQATRLAPFRERGWDLRVLPELEPWEGPGVVYANELLDALPVHRVRIAGAAVQEAWVVLEDEKGELREEWGPLSEAAGDELRFLFGTVDASRLRLLTVDGHLELRPVFGSLLSRLAESFRGPVCLVWIDYGDRLRGPREEPAAGLPQVPHCRTARGYFKHQETRDLYRLAGRQDLTADVDFRALDLHGSRAGFERLFLSSLAAFLRSLGGEGDLEELTRAEYSLERDAEATVLAALLDEGDLGGLFKVMVQVREE